MNLPNQITIARLVLAVILFVLLETACRGVDAGGMWYVAFVLFVVTVLTDGLDGYLARSRHQETVFGRIADPFADKIAICGVLVLANDLPQTHEYVPAAVILVVLAREFLVSGLRGYLEGQGIRFGARWEGKAKLIVQAIYCGAVLFVPATGAAWVRHTATAFLWLTLLVTAFSAISYVRSALRLMGGAGAA